MRTCQRPGNGTLGRHISLHTNYFELKFHPDLLLYWYEVRITHANQDTLEIVGRQVATQVILRLLRTELAVYQRGIASDGYKNLITRCELPLHDAPYLVDYQQHCYQVMVVPAGVLQFSQIYQLLKEPAENRHHPLTEAHIHALNIILGHQPKFSPDIKVSGAGTYLDLDSRMSLGSGLHMLRGLFLVAREAQGRLFVNAAPKIAICYDDVPLDRLILAYMRQNGSDMHKIAGLVHNLRVQVTHLGMRKRAGSFVPRVKTICGLAAPGDGNGLVFPPRIPWLGAGARDVQFFREPRSPAHEVDSGIVLGSRKRKRPLSEGYVTIMEYFQSVYNIAIDDSWLPVVNVGTVANPSYLPAQVCRVLPGQSVPAAIGAAQFQQGTRGGPDRRRPKATPASRFASMETELSSVLGLSRTGGATLTSFGVTLVPGMAKVSGRVLDPPSIEYRQGRQAAVQGGGWNLRGMRFAKSTCISRWTYLWVSMGRQSHQPRPDKYRIEEAIQKFCTRMKMLGINIPDARRPGMKVSLTDSSVTMEGVPDSLAHALDSIDGASLSFLLIILPQAAERLYSRIKYLCDVKRGIRNVCVIEDKFLRSNDQFLSNVALKLNLKLGGINQTLPDHSLGIIGNGKTMVVGVDVTHPTSGSLPARAPSVAAMVASVDRFLAQWPAELCIQPARQELVTQIDALLTSRLHVWRRFNRGQLPENILIYRDGVSDTQYGSVLSVELPRLREACNDLYGSMGQPEPRISIVVVGKRHHTRFFTAPRPGQRHGGPQHTNPPNGTVVDQGPANSSKVWDFYLQSHTASRGIARPGHYVVLLDEIFQPPQSKAHPNPANAIQALTHNICYISGRAMRASSVCPPVVYADLACFRARFYVEEMLCQPSRGDTYPLELSLHENVKDTMFYI
ncbi:argonaute/piwi family protein [Aspergillus ibericus CBS 121593]|uniref:Piwi-domain-containing protein n=1 Tax=Aspergillus ibericus CBS 121593 TaxID=1448316 RepID=A0A395GU21_9EURO|nr:Piwi-domain-containing protein [Aspergillus ibericus CBS 121593]RAK98177.1 Piwi-domain-containing protein [Aspergillus ibericus CBS 121593]